MQRRWPTAHNNRGAISSGRKLISQLFSAAGLAALVACESTIIAPYHIIQLEVRGIGHGNVTAELEGADDYTCSSSAEGTWGKCEHEFRDAGGGGSYTLVPAAISGYHFSTWGGRCAGTAPSQPCTVSWVTGDVKIDEITLNIGRPFDVLPPASVALVSGALTSIRVRVTRALGFTAPIALTTSTTGGLPVSLSTAPVSSAAGVEEWTLTIDAQGHTAPTSTVHRVSVTASGGGHAPAVEFNVAINPLPPPIAGFTLILPNDSIDVERGGTANTPLEITRTGVLTSSIQLTHGVLPDGISLSITPNQATATTTTSSIRVAADSNVAPGTYGVAITGSLQQLTRTTTLTLTVVDPDFTIEAIPNRLTVPAGASANLALNVNRLSAAIGAVTLSAQNEPNGIKVLFSNNPETRTQSHVTVAVASSVAPGSYDVQLVGEAFGVRRLDTMTVVVTNPAVSIAMSPHALTLTAGGPPDQTFLVVRGATYQVGATITVPKPPSGVIVTITPSNTVLGGFSIEFTAAASAPAGTFIVDIHVIVSGVTYVQPITLTVRRL